MRFLLCKEVPKSLGTGLRIGNADTEMTIRTRAAERPLYLAPEDERDEGRGKDFLYEFEAGKEREAGGDVGAGGGDGEGGEGEGSKGKGGEAEGSKVEDDQA